MKNSKVFKTVFSAFLFVVIIGATVFASKESQGIESNENSATADLDILITNMTINSIVLATAEGMGGFYYGTLVNPSDIRFPTGMPAGNYKIVICTSVSGSRGGISSYSYYNNSLNYNGQEQTVYGTVNPSSPCVHE